jgi:hypothetical protein
VHPVCETLTHYFSCSCGIGSDSRESIGTRYTEFVFLHPVGSCGSRSALQCIQGVKRRGTIFLARMGPVRIPQKCVTTPYAKLVFLHPVVSAGHVVHSGAFGV